MEPKLQWEYVADTVMGGVSTGRITQEVIAGRSAVRLTGQVSLDHDGGFVQMASDLGTDHGPCDVSAFDGVAIDVIGNGERYDLRLRTTDLDRPWQSYRLDFVAPPTWTTHRFAFASLEPHRTQVPFKPARLRRLGVLAVGRVFTADVAVAGLRFYRNNR